MRFEHFVEIDDVLNPLAVLITREELWRGLVLRAEEPALFVPTLSEARIVTRTASSLERVLRFGDVSVTDTVRFEPLHHVHYDIAEQGGIPRSSLRMSIEEPGPGALFVRFVYEDERTPAEDAQNQLFDEIRRAAYEEADIATIGTIRRLIEVGRADAN